MNQEQKELIAKLKAGKGFMSIGWTEVLVLTPQEARAIAGIISEAEGILAGAHDALMMESDHVNKARMEQKYRDRIVEFLK